MPFNVLLLPLLGGYVFVSHFNPTRFKMRRQSGRKVLFDSALAGVFLLSLGILAAMTLNALAPSTKIYWKQFAPFNYSGASALSLLFGFLGYKIGNWIFPRKKTIEQGVKREGDHFEAIVARSLECTEQISVTTSVGKVYVGLVTCGIQHAHERQYLRLWPMASGYRDSNTQEMVLTNHYAPVYERLYLINGKSVIDPEEFEIVIPTDSIELLSLFDVTAYSLFREQKEGGEIEGGNSGHTYFSGMPSCFSD